MRRERKVALAAALELDLSSSHIVQSVIAPAPEATDRREPSTLEVGLVVFAAYNLLLGLFMAIAPHAFFTAIGPFGARNDHYVRDVATYNLALGAGFAVALRRVSWRVPVIAVATIQFALHSLNHLADIGAAHPTWTGYFDFFSLAAATGLLVWLWRRATKEARA